MAHRVAPQAEAELDDIWYYVAKESGSIAIADRLIDSITERFYLLACHPHIGGPAMRICVLACAVFRWASMSSSTA
jgi:plasmid stabilization system protein ParE